ncbi:hypothetical protein Tco_0241649 [Tanacetum coccineum]
MSVKGERVNILKSIDEGPFQMGTFRETLAEGTEGALHLGPEHLIEVKKRNDFESILALTPNDKKGELIWGAQNRVGNANPGSKTD